MRAYSYAICSDASSTIIATEGRSHQLPAPLSLHLISLAFITPDAKSKQQEHVDQLHGACANFSAALATIKRTPESGSLSANALTTRPHNQAVVSRMRPSDRRPNCRISHSKSMRSSPSTRSNNASNKGKTRSSSAAAKRAESDSAISPSGPCQIAISSVQGSRSTTKNPAAPHSPNHWRRSGLWCAAGPRQNTAIKKFTCTHIPPI